MTAIFKDFAAVIGRQAAAVRRRDHRPRLPAPAGARSAPSVVPLTAALMNLIAAAASFGVAGGGLPVGLGHGAARPRQGRARSTPSCRSSCCRSSSASRWTTRSSWSAGCTRNGSTPKDNRRAVRVGLRRDQPGHQLRGPDHDLRVPRVRPERRPGDRDVRASASPRRSRWTRSSCVRSWSRPLMHLLGRRQLVAAGGPGQAAAASGGGTAGGRPEGRRRRQAARLGGPRFRP